MVDEYSLQDLDQTHATTSNENHGSTAQPRNVQTRLDAWLTAVSFPDPAYLPPLPASTVSSTDAYRLDSDALHCGLVSPGARDRNGSLEDLERISSWGLRGSKYNQHEVLEVAHPTAPAERSQAPPQQFKKYAAFRDELKRLRTRAHESNDGQTLNWTDVTVLDVSNETYYKERILDLQPLPSGTKETGQCQDKPSLAPTAVNEATTVDTRQKDPESTMRSVREFRDCLRETPETDVYARFILVEVSDTGILDALGEEFDLDPDFFEIHMRHSTKDPINGVIGRLQEAIYEETVEDRAVWNTSPSPVKVHRSVFLKTKPKLIGWTDLRKPPTISWYDHLEREFTTIEWEKVAILREVTGKGYYSSMLDTMCRRIFCPDANIPSQPRVEKEIIGGAGEEDNIGIDFHARHLRDELVDSETTTPRDSQQLEIHEGTNGSELRRRLRITRTVNPRLQELLSDNRLEAIVAERLSIYEVVKGGIPTMIVLCDPIPTTTRQPLYELKHDRGFWSAKIDLMSQPTLRASTKDTLASWIKEEALRSVDAQCLCPRSIYPFALEMVTRDTHAMLSYTQFKAQEIQSDMLVDSADKVNRTVWREWLSGVLLLIEAAAESLATFQDSYIRSIETRVSESKRWTSLTTEKQSPLDRPITYQQGGQVASKEISSTQRSTVSLRRRVQATKETLKNTDELLRTTLSLQESDRAIVEARNVTKLTELAFIFIPLSFAASFFSIPLDILNGSVSLTAFVIFAVVLLVAAYAVRLFIRASFVRKSTDWLSLSIRQRRGLPRGARISNSQVVLFLRDVLFDSIAWVASFRVSRYRIFKDSPVSGLLGFGFVFALPTVLLWALYGGHNSLKGTLTGVVFMIWLSTVIFELSMSEHSGSSSHASFSIHDYEPMFSSPQEALSTFAPPAVLLCCLLVPVIVIWCLIPASIGAKIGLTCAALFAAALGACVTGSLFTIGFGLKSLVSWLLKTLKLSPNRITLPDTASSPIEHQYTPTMRSQV